MQTLQIPFQTGSPPVGEHLEENLSEKKSVESARRIVLRSSCKREMKKQRILLEGGISPLSPGPGK